MSDRIAIGVLTGGQSTRMGFPKELVYDSWEQGKPETMLERAVRELDFFEDKYLSMNKEQTYSFPNWQNVIDEFEQIGPMGGILSLLNKANAQGVDAVMVVAVDMPGFSRKEALEMLNAYQGEDVMLARVNQILQPLAGIYRVSCIEKIREKIQNKELRVRKIFEEMPNGKAWDTKNEKCYQNVNSPEQIDAFFQET